MYQRMHGVEGKQRERHVQPVEIVIADSRIRPRRIKRNAEGENQAGARAYSAPSKKVIGKNDEQDMGERIEKCKSELRAQQSRQWSNEVQNHIGVIVQ